MEQLRPYLSKHIPDTPENTFNIITYEHGSVVKQFYRWKWKGNTPEGRAYLAEMRQAHADHIIQCFLLAEQMDWNLDGLIADGTEAFKERMKDIDNWVEERDGHS